MGNKESRILPFNKDVLIWARTRRALTPEEAAKSAGVKVERIHQWESGERVPTGRQGRMLARAYKVHFLEFFSSDIPPRKEVKLVPDFRNLRKKPSKKELVALRDIQGWAESHRLNALDLLEELGDEPLILPPSLRAKEADDVEEASAKARKAVGFDISEQLGLGHSKRHLLPSMLRDALEKQEMLVLKNGDLAAIKARGICIYASPMPVIVYGLEAPTAQAFTLAHELAHIMLRSSAVIGDMTSFNCARTQKTEDWCNRFAAAFLIPKKHIADMLGQPRNLPSIDDDLISEVASKFSASGRASLMRLVHLGYVQPKNHWTEKRLESMFQEENCKPYHRSKFRGNKYQDSLGNFYTSLVLEAWGNDLITAHNASELMGIKRLKHLIDIRQHFGT